MSKDLYNHQKWEAELNHKGALESFNAMIGFASSTIKGLFASNAGAIGVLLAFAVKEEGCLSNSHLKSAVIVYVIGIATAILTSFSAYLAQVFYTGTQNHRGHIARCFGVVFALTSLWCFVYGALIATGICSALSFFPN